MLARVRRFLDIRPGETLPVLATFLYIAVVIAAYLLAKAIRSGLFLKEYGAYALPYVYAARAARRVGLRPHLESAVEQVRPADRGGLDAGVLCRQRGAVLVRRSGRMRAGCCQPSSIYG